MREADVQNSIRLALNEHAVLFRVNTGTVQLADGRYFSTGVPKGFSDLCGFRKSDGKMIFIEVKNEKGQLRDDQKKFLEEMKKYDVIAGVCRTPEQAIRLVNEHPNIVESAESTE